MNKVILALAAVICAGMIPLSSFAYTPGCEGNGSCTTSGTCDGSCSGTGICQNYDGCNAARPTGQKVCQGQQSSHHGGQTSSSAHHGQGRHGVHHA